MTPLVTHTMTPEEEAEWERKARAGELFATGEIHRPWIKSEFPRGHFDTIKAALMERFPEQVALYGDYKTLADEVGVSREAVRRIAAQLGMRVLTRAAMQARDKSAS